MTDNTALATERVLKARTEVVLTRRFYGVLIANVTPVPTRKIETMATNGTHHFYNPDFICSHTQDEVVFFQIHESEHDARRHHTRRNGRDMEKWNIACDYAINIDLRDQGFKVPAWAYCDPKYRGMSAEDIYRSRELDEKAQQQQQQQQDQQEQDDQDDADQSDDQDQDSGADAADQGDDQSDDSEGAGDDEADGEGDDAEGEEAGDGEGQGDAEGQGEGQGDGEPSDQAGGQGEGQGDGEAGEGKPGPDANVTSCGDPGKCGEVLDASDDPTETIEQDQKWDRILRQAAQVGRGDTPGHATQEIERLNKPGRDWRDELREWFDAGASKVETWNKLNKRVIGSGIYLPGSKRDGLNTVVLLVDTSGSMDETALGCIAVEAQAAMDEAIIDRLVVVYGDTRVTGVDEYAVGDQIVFDPKGRGGTDMKPLFEYVAENEPDASLIIGFTDLDIGDPGPEPTSPVLWAVTGYPQDVKRHLAATPWNAPGIDVGSH